MKIDSLPKDMVLVRETCGIRVLPNLDHHEQTMPGFYIQEPLVGFIKKGYWEGIDVFQSICIEENEVIQRKSLTFT